MKKLTMYNQLLLEEISKQVEIVCDENMNMVLTDEEAEKLEMLIEKEYPCAMLDYYLTDL
jgi:hypothetical protein